VNSHGNAIQFQTLAIDPPKNGVKLLEREETKQMLDHKCAWQSVSELTQLKDAALDFSSHQRDRLLGDERRDRVAGRGVSGWTQSQRLRRWFAPTSQSASAKIFGHSWL
jgi:hypothetical protein